MVVHTTDVMTIIDDSSSGKQTRRVRFEDVWNADSTAEPENCPHLSWKSDLITNFSYFLLFYKLFSFNM